MEQNFFVRIRFENSGFVFIQLREVSLSRLSWASFLLDSFVVICTPGSPSFFVVLFFLGRVAFSIFLLLFLIKKEIYMLKLFFFSQLVIRKIIIIKKKLSLLNFILNFFFSFFRKNKPRKKKENGKFFFHLLNFSCAET